MVDDIGQGAVGHLVAVEASADSAADALGVVGNVHEHLLRLDWVRFDIDVKADVLSLEAVHLADELVTFGLELCGLLRAHLTSHFAIYVRDGIGDALLFDCDSEHAVLAVDGPQTGDAANRPRDGDVADGALVVYLLEGATTAVPGE